jgi:capsular polysaccharide biosynthesis protein
VSPRKFAKTLRHHVRRAQISALAAPRHFPSIRRRLHLPANRAFDPLRDPPPAGVNVHLLDPAETFLRPLPDLPGAPAATRAYYAGRAEDVCDARCVVELPGGLAWGHPTGGVFTADGVFIPAFTHDPSGAHLHTVWTRLRLPAPRPLPGRTLYLLTPEATDNYHHWLIDLLPRLGLVRRAGYDLAAFDHVIVNHRRRSYQLATLARFGLTPDKLILASESLFICAESLVVPSLKPNPQCLPAADLAFLRASFLPPVPPSPRRRLFLDRGDAAFRRLHDADRIHQLARTRGYEILSPAGLDVSAQAELFASAEVIAGPAGAAFANLVFAQPPARVLEIASPRWPAVFHWMISARLGLAHTILFGDGPAAPGLPDVADRRADIAIRTDRLAPHLAPTSSFATFPAGPASIETP